MTDENQDEKPRCETCLFLEQGPIDKNNVAVKDYFCKRMPPTVVVMPAAGGIALHTVSPMVNLETWCGEYDTIEEPDDSELGSVNELEQTGSI